MRYDAWLWQSTCGVRTNILMRIVIGCLQVVSGLLMVWLSKLFIDVTIRQGSDRDIIWMIVLLIVVVLSGIILRQCYFYMMTSAKARLKNQMQLKLYRLLFRRNLYQGEKLHSGDITSRLEKDVDAISDTATTLMPLLIVTGIQVVGAFFLLHSMDRRLAWILLIATPFVIVFGKLITHSLRNMTLEIRQQESEIQMQMQEGMENNEVLLTMGNIDWVTDRFGFMQQKLLHKVLKRTRFTMATRLLLASCFGLGYLLAFVWGGLQLRSGAITFGVMTSFLQLVSLIQNPIFQILNIIPQLIHTLASIDRLQELERLEAERETKDKEFLLLGEVGAKLENVSYKYESEEEEIISNFSFDFKPGSRTALIGRTGVGKTTIFRLLLALIKPLSGHVHIYSSTEEKEASADSRVNFVYVPQGNSLLSGSIRYNLQLAKPDATEDEIKEVLHVAMADFVLDLPEGIDTVIGERGTGLSGGQAQRIAIARGLLRPGGILLLDEISSSLDEKTECELYQRLLKYAAGKTMIFITHRQSVAAFCDKLKLADLR